MYVYYVYICVLYIHDTYIYIICILYIYIFHAIWDTLFDAICDCIVSSTIIYQTSPVSHEGGDSNFERAGDEGVSAR